MNKRTVAVISTLDTKGSETEYIKRRIEACNLDTLVIDCGLRGQPRIICPDISKEYIAQAAGVTMEQLSGLSRGEAVEIMIQGLQQVLLDLYGKGRFHGVIGIGGLQGTTLGTGGMKALPVGIPKLMVTPTASGNFRFGPYVGQKDMMLLHSVTDILGMNPISMVVFDNAANAIAGMVAGADPPITWKTKKMIAVTMMGNTTPAIMRIKEKLESAGFELVVFHANGTGGTSMESLIHEGIFIGCLDFTLHEVTDFIVGGDCRCGPERLDAACRAGIPLVLVPGGINYIVQPGPDQISDRFTGRSYYLHNSSTTLVRTSRSEMKQAADFISAKLRQPHGPCVMMIPRNGFSMHVRPGEALHDPEGDEVFIKALQESLPADVKTIVVDAAVNDDLFADRTAGELLRLLGHEHS